MLHKKRLGNNTGVLFINHTGIMHTHWTFHSLLLTDEHIWCIGLHINIRSADILRLWNGNEFATLARGIFFRAWPLSINIPSSCHTCMIWNKLLDLNGLCSYLNSLLSFASKLLSPALNPVNVLIKLNN